MGDMMATMSILVVGNPEVDFLYEHRKGDLLYQLDTVIIKAELGDVPINAPEAIRFIHEHLRGDF
ncbi:hypothetical protein AUJ95_09205 [Candidatus Desantisbacteria bacterium CG2_30_40_21]|uniref:Uncharacterized protein n=5 Tax=unclassified Candidatus Desantisiibacteriota TaxID=3106372 RepID=A0A2M7J8E7_9BACT|nr:MAG: hypothetical protein AUJ95_09205 [Candidatus Desantisbacteria bacterium CG2_30_40_21]PIP40771.1 MAG: hypothetical protein COX18_05630 [Candidatus Desantisbacteria bacterium CG23_combo_of_CG06-09_8_20_14_all_40_23]PIX15648.1 MAG: hypothetical protein COZ71_09840 [Candidatus Desantisbacteria bacterium CG_4_8_14_3_um_filter_40_12]PIY18956.1 MAG: hypothetical protein COZ13_07855 [Candidatus Desantisbacteria bacterium CG_4_10_14_3_um_filter_40_18]PJB29435.1 MAG: hypothetical protein CO110_05